MSVERPQTTRLGISFVGAGAVALAVLELVTRVAEEFEPRRIVSVGLVVSVALLGLTIQRIAYLVTRRARERDRAVRLSESLRIWPPQRCREADPLALGVWPADPSLTPAGTALPPYVAREADRPAEDALRAGGLVFITGPPGSGKTRTAYEVLRKVRPDARLIVPEDAEVFNLVASGDFALGPDDVLWLDDLQRFVDQLDGKALRLLERTDILIVATLRDEPLARLRTADGVAGDRGQRLLVAAQLLSLPSDLTAGELARAGELLPGVDLGGGFGPGLTRTVQGGRPSPAQVRQAGRGEERRGTAEPAARGVRVRSIARRLDPVLVVAVALTCTAVGALALSVAVDGFSQPSVGEQVESIRADARAEGWRVAGLEEAELRGPGLPSYVILLSDEEGGETRRPPELRIYDEEDGQLHRRLTFSPADEDLRFAGLHLSEVRDLDQDDDRELLVAIAANLGGGPFRVPVVIRPDELTGTYIVEPALEDPAPYPRSFQSALVPHLRKPFQLTDGGPPIRGFATEAFAVVPTDIGGLQLLTGVSYSYAADRYLFTVGAYLIDQRNGRIVFGRRCNPGVAAELEQTVADIATTPDEALSELGPTADRAFPGLVFPDGDCEYLESG